MEDQNVRGEMNALEIDEWVYFPLKRYEYTLGCRTKLQDATGKKFKSKKFKSAELVGYQRTA